MNRPGTKSPQTKFLNVDDFVQSRAQGSRRPWGRFIPACAGNRRRLVVPLVYRPVHPRVCGEQERRQLVRPVLSGSSPRVRGTEVGHYGFGIIGRFIPACAGNSVHGEIAGVALPVHPRVCGEQGIRGGLPVVTFGSSPRVRGTGLIVDKRADALRFIPACAGNSLVYAFAFYDPPVHPRVCGEQPDARIPRSRHTGSSPRVRGTETQLKSVA